MRFCPFCSGQNDTEANACVQCGRKLPPLIRRRSTSVSQPPAPVSSVREKTISPPSTPTAPPPEPLKSRAQTTPGIIDIPPVAQRRDPPRPVVEERTPAQPARRETDVGTPPPALTRTPEAADNTPRIRTARETFHPPEVSPLPTALDDSYVTSALYTLRALRAKYSRRKAVRRLEQEVRESTASLDDVLARLGKLVRSQAVPGEIFESENQKIDKAEIELQHVRTEITALGKERSAENRRFAEIEADRLAKIDEAKRVFELAKANLRELSGQEKTLREGQKRLEREHKGLLQSATELEEKSSQSDSPHMLLEQARDFRGRAQGISGELQRHREQLHALRDPFAMAEARTEALDVDLESAKRSLEDVRAAHRHRVGQIENNLGEKGRRADQIEIEIREYLIMLGRIGNLHRSQALLDNGEFAEHYLSIDSVKNAIGLRTETANRLRAEQDAVDKSLFYRGAAVLGATTIALVLLIILLSALF